MASKYSDDIIIKMPGSQPIRHFLQPKISRPTVYYNKRFLSNQRNSYSTPTDKYVDSTNGN